MYIQRDITQLLKKEGNPAICNNMNGPWGHNAKWNKSEKNTVWSHLYVEYKTKLTDTVHRLVVPKSGSCGVRGGWGG